MWIPALAIDGDVVVSGDSVGVVKVGFIGCESVVVLPAFTCTCVPG
jgi:hypothetical protein